MGELGNKAALYTLKLYEPWKAGVEFVFGPMETSVCNMAFVKDPDGNSVGIHKRKLGVG